MFRRPLAWVGGTRSDRHGFIERNSLLAFSTAYLAAENKGLPAKTIMPDAIIYIVATKKDATIKKMAVPWELARMTLQPVP